ncbi:MAG: tripartite tricarboxylate transporter TctB family protein [Microbacterium sp.]|jgi:putative tricarboxylic transport membrane protein|uniref:tripartite tricarboxylate transporter TctB family protein n=1 Tax=Microbacterium sp. TaxID=51671 RepID=UPI0025FE7FDB|nr:tripartite tricarboxylate transporter TctB family protein [Microbacterium sp.]MBQ9916154.1 tripartite tricarboxylate transporter TctB family protein [Microbacterium sp.]
MPSNNPTSVSAVVGDKLRFRRGRGASGIAKALVMPTVLAAFATYLVYGIVTMRVPASAAFPGPQFFPGIIAAGLYVFAVILGIAAVRSLSENPTTDATIPAAGEAPATAASVEVPVGADATAERAVGVDWRSFAWVVGPFLIFAFLLGILGWIIAAALLFAGIARGFGHARPLFALFVGATISSLTYIAFDMGLGLSLPSGILGWAF